MQASDRGFADCPSRASGRWVARDDIIRYLEKYADFHGIEVTPGVEVTRVERGPTEGGGWLLRIADGREPALARSSRPGRNPTARLPGRPGGLHR
ncbi:hypothetical protein [Streptomyces sp. NPDC017964]|uniref:hypothetical protein n=1 Tax=Streptomyces sp. NPDC017964 TaxID=3365022 RepID=UPI003787895B